MVLAVVEVVDSVDSDLLLATPEPSTSDSAASSINAFEFDSVALSVVDDVLVVLVVVVADDLGTKDDFFVTTTDLGAGVVL